jgi:hypothetical protein
MCDGDSAGFQTWICPRCYDDHMMENHERCAKNLREDIDELRTKSSELILDLLKVNDSTSMTDRISIAKRASDFFEQYKRGKWL